MQLSRYILLLILSLACLLPAAHAARVRRRPASAHTRSARRVVHTPRPARALRSRQSRNSKSVPHKVRGQRSIDSKRAREIQRALIREHYLNGRPSGTWDGASKAAMKRYQADQGWQTHLVPDARALVKLGLGPDYSKAINAKGSSFSSVPSTVQATSTTEMAAVPQG